MSGDVPRSLSLPIQGMDCAGCATTVERALRDVHAVAPLRQHLLNPPHLPLDPLEAVLEARLDAVLLVSSGLALTHRRCSIPW